MIPFIVAAILIVGVVIYLTVLKYIDMPTKRATAFAFLISAIFIPILYLFFRSVCVQNIFGSSSVLNGSYTIEDERQILAQLPLYRAKNVFVYAYLWVDTLLLRIGFFDRIFAAVFSLSIFTRISVCIGLTIVYELLLGRVLHFSEGFADLDEKERIRVQERNAKTREYNANLPKVYEQKTTVTRDYYNENVYHVDSSTRDVTRYKDEELEPLPTTIKRMLFLLLIFLISPLASSILLGAEAALGWILTKKHPY